MIPLSGELLKSGTARGPPLHDSWLGALAARLIIVHHKFTRDLPGDKEEAASSWGISTHYNRQDRKSSRDCSGEKWLGRQPRLHHRTGSQLDPDSTYEIPGFCCAPQGDLKFVILLSQPTKCFNYKHGPSCPTLYLKSRFSSLSLSPQEHKRATASQAHFHKGTGKYLKYRKSNVTKVLIQTFTLLIRIS